jgi:uncharacterized membrane protein
MTEPNAPRWFMAESGQRIGPMDLGELRARLTDGRHAPDTPVWREGWQDWRPAEDAAEFRNLFASAPTPPAGGPPMQPAPAPQSRDSTSNLLAILGYVSLLVSGAIPFAFVLPIVVMAIKRDAYSLYHAKQAVTLLIVTVVASIVCIPLVFVLFIGIPLLFVVVIGSIVLAIIGIVNASKGEMKPLPIVGGWAESWWSSLATDA